MEVDFHSMIMEGPFCSHTSYCILTRGEGLGSSVCLLYIKALISLRRLHLYNHHLTKAPPLDTITTEVRISSYEISGEHKVWDNSRSKGELTSSSSSGCLHPHSTAPPFSAPPCNHSIHSITLGFTRPGQSSLNSISYSAYSMFPSPLLRPRGPTRKQWCVHFCKVPSLSLSGSLVLRPCWNRVAGNEMGKFWHHWLTWCCCSSLVVKRDWPGIPPDWQMSLLWGTLVIFQHIHKLEVPDFILSFSIRVNVLAPTAHHLQYSPQPLCSPRSASTFWRKLISLKSATH